MCFPDSSALISTYFEFYFQLEACFIAGLNITELALHSFFAIPRICLPNYLSFNGYHSNYLLRLLPIFIGSKLFSSIAAID